MNAIAGSNATELSDDFPAEGAPDEKLLFLLKFGGACSIEP
jgi:hypothetical protein